MSRTDSAFALLRRFGDLNLAAEDEGKLFAETFIPTTVHAPVRSQ